MKITECPKEKLGTRDAVHVPAIVCESVDRLEPGEKVRFTDSEWTCVESAGNSEAHGIVDPFNKNVDNNRVLILVDPKYIGEVRHTFDLNIDDVDEPYDDGCRGCYN